VFIKYIYYERRIIIILLRIGLTRIRTNLREFEPEAHLSQRLMSLRFKPLAEGRIYANEDEFTRIKIVRIFTNEDEFTRIKTGIKSWGI
jgi:hypothetical protein